MTPRRRVLVLSYFFPPAGGVASVRVSSWTRLLPEFGWEATVVAALSPDAPVRDAALGIGEGTEAIRAGEIPLRRLLQRLKWLGVPARALDGAVDRIWPDPFVGWAPFAHAAASRRLREGGIDAILSVSNPFTPHWIGLRLAGRARLPWVAFFSDDMSRNPDPRIRPRARSLRSLERAVLERADGVAAATEGVAQRLAANREVEVARNGYDEEEVASVRREVSGSSRSSRFRLCHVGSMYVLNGGTAFLDGLACAVSRSKEFAREASVAFIGDADVSFRDAVVRRGLSGTASFAGASSHDAGLREAASSEAGLVLVGEYPGAWARLPVKLYEYLGLGLPVVAVAPEGLCDRIVRDAGGIVARPGDPEGICAALLSAHGDWRAGRLRACGDPGRLYTRRASVRILAGLLDRACAGRPASGTLDPMRGGRS